MTAQVDFARSKEGWLFSQAKILQKGLEIQTTVVGSGGILPQKTVKIEFLKNEISGILRPGQHVIMSIFLI